MGYAISSKQKETMTFHLDTKKVRKGVRLAKYLSNGIKPIVHVATIS
jgi:hypothetical protein